MRCRSSTGEKRSAIDASAAESEPLAPAITVLTVVLPAFLAATLFFEPFLRPRRGASSMATAAAALELDLDLDPALL